MPHPIPLPLKPLTLTDGRRHAPPKSGPSRLLFCSFRSSRKSRTSFSHLPSAGHGKLVAPGDGLNHDVVALDARLEHRVDGALDQRRDNRVVPSVNEDESEPYESAGNRCRRADRAWTMRTRRSDPSNCSEGPRPFTVGSIVGAML